MPEFFAPYDADRPLTLRCHCDRDHASQAHDRTTAALPGTASQAQAYTDQFVEVMLVKALFPEAAVRAHRGQDVRVPVQLRLPSSGDGAARPGAWGCPSSCRASRTERRPGLRG